MSRTAGREIKRIVISGYYGFNNTGDEAVLFSMIRELQKRLPGVKIRVLSHNPAQTKRAYGVKAVNRWNPLAILKAVARCDLLISGGGSLLQDATGPKSIAYYLAIVWLAKLFGKRAVFYAQGIGPVTGDLGRNLMRRIANRVDLITVRDHQSYMLLHELGIKKPPIHITADPVLGLTPEAADTAAGQQVLCRAGIAQLNTGNGERKPGGQAVVENPFVDVEECPGMVDRPLVGIALREWKGLTGYHRAVAAAADFLAERGCRVVFIPFHFPEDIAVGREVARLMGSPAVVLKEQLDTPRMLGVLGRCDLVLGMRLHALIMAAVMGVPAVGLSYDPKVDSFMKQVGLPVAGKVETVTGEELVKLLAEILPNLANLRDRMTGPVADLRRLAVQTADLVLNTIGK